jgi:hypothetical protein
MAQAQDGECPGSEVTDQVTQQGGGSGKRAMRFSPARNGRSGRRCQHAEHKPRPA